MWKTIKNGVKKKIDQRIDFEKLLQIGGVAITIWGSFDRKKWADVINNRSRSCYLQIEVNLRQTGAGITNLSSFVTNRGNYYKLVQDNCIIFLKFSRNFYLNKEVTLLSMIVRILWHSSKRCGIKVVQK